MQLIHSHITFNMANTSEVDPKNTENQFSNFLSNSCITQECLEKVIQQFFETSATFDGDICFERIGFRQGFLSIMLRVQFNWKPKSEQTARLPQSFVLKIPSTAHFRSNFDVWQEILNMVHPNEVTFYKLIRNAENINLRIPKCYGCQDFGPNGHSGFLMFEDLSQIGAIKSIFKGLSVDALQQVMENLASLHAFSLKHVDLQSLQLKSSFFEMYNKDIPEAKKELLEGMDLLNNENAEYLGPLLDRLHSLVENNSQPYSAIQIQEDLNIPLVLTHGDLYMFNIMWRKTGDGNKTSDELVAFVDFQNAHAGSIAEDFVHLFCTSVSPEIRRAHFDDLIEHYHSSLTEKLGSEPPFTTDQIKITYRRFMPYALVMLLPIWRAYSSQKNFHVLQLDQKDRERKRQRMLDICKCAIENWYKSMDE